MGLLSSILSIPYIILFFGVWIVASLLRPVLLACFLACLCQPKATLRKLQLFATTVMYLLFCNDKGFKLSRDDPASHFTEDDTGVESKTIVFVRHGESLWNYVFNKGSDRSKINFALYFVPNLIYALFMEWYLFVSGKSNDSWFYDSPLSEKGLRQAVGVQDFLRTSLEYSTPREQLLIQLMLGETPGSEENPPPAKSELSSQLVSSNLRRAISTMAVGFQDRLEDHPDDSILILPQLQEISRNPDALSITPAKGKAVLSLADPEELEAIFSQQIDTSLHTGNKPISTNGGQRLQEFCDVVFDDIRKDSVIAAGHSLWFRSFFRAYLPRSLDHVSKRRKLVNGGCAGFVLKRKKTADGKNHYLIDPTSITVLHGGF